MLSSSANPTASQSIPGRESTRDLIGVFSNLRTGSWCNSPEHLKPPGSPTTNPDPEVSQAFRGRRAFWLYPAPSTLSAHMAIIRISGNFDRISRPIPSPLCDLCVLCGYFLSHLGSLLRGNSCNSCPPPFPSSRSLRSLWLFPLFSRFPPVQIRS